MTLFLVGDSANVSELEGLVVATAQPPGNKQKPKIGQDLRKQLRRYSRVFIMRSTLERHDLDWPTQMTGYGAQVLDDVEELLETLPFGELAALSV